MRPEPPGDRAGLRTAPAWRRNGGLVGTFLLAAVLLLVAACGSSGSAPAPASGSTSGTGTPGVFAGSILLGSPTASSIKANVLSAAQGGMVYLACGTVKGTYPVSYTHLTLPTIYSV